MPFVDHRLIANPLVVQIMRRLWAIDRLGTLLHSRRAAAVRHEAPPHRDGNPLFPELPFALPVSGLSVDIPE